MVEHKIIRLVLSGDKCKHCEASLLEVDYDQDVDGLGLTLCDLKTTGSEKDKPDAYLANYFCQLGAYALGLDHLSKIRPKSGLILIAKGDGTIQARSLSLLELEGAKSLFRERMEIYRKLLDLGAVH